MQDKEFDRLFRDNLEDIEITPSRNLWPGIEEATGETGRKRSLIPFLSIAASIIVLIAAEVLFIPKRTAIVKQQSVKLAANVTKSEKQEPVVSREASLPAAVVPSKSAVALSAAAVVHIAHHKMVNEPKVEEQTTPTAAVQQPVIAQAPVIKVTSPQQAIDNTQIASAQPAQQPVAIKPEEIAAIPVTEESAAAVPAKKHRIHSFGDMLNVVIAAVDKRKDKFIEFSNTDGDEATITGINLGIIRVKKEN